ncbi:hypothetical protein GE061_000238 [Apolygus lucorum]|uniref:Uncharacterized protein n=1 Tax=Apolygus lucorum TaxID=248454 RepID=A0A8S9Y411_APOLU|nr:hypothetical protein GE061_000238 [Apolygus lucorum]
MLLTSVSWFPACVWLFTTATAKPSFYPDDVWIESTDFASSTEATNELHFSGLDYTSFENRIQSYIDQGKSWISAVISNRSQFLEEIDDYLTRLPRNATKILISTSRDVCHCGGKMMMPCPLRCQYSCYLKNSNFSIISDEWRHEDDCRGVHMQECRCHKCNI